MEKDVMYFYSSTYGTGFVNGYPEQEELNLFFEDGKRHTVRINEIFSITQLLKEYQKRAYYSLNITKMRTKGIQLFQDGKVYPDKAKITNQTRGSFIVNERADTKVKCIAEGRALYTYLQCDCGSRLDCVHKIAVLEYFKNHVQKLKDIYVDSDSETDKSLFVSSRFTEAIDNYLKNDRKHESYDKYLEMLTPMVEDLKRHPTADYIATALDYVFSVAEEYFYDWGFEDKINYLASAICAEKTLYGVVISPANYEQYQERYYYPDKYKNARAIFKRAVKNYKDICKDLEKGKYYRSEMMIFVLNQRSDYSTLLKYYSECTDRLSIEELRGIGALDGKIVLTNDERRQLTPEITKLLMMTDVADYGKELSAAAFKVLIALLPADETIPVMSRLRKNYMSLEDYKQLSRENQKLLAGSMYADEEVIRYVLDNVLTDSKPGDKAEYIVSALQKLPYNERSIELEKYIMKIADGLPHNTLLKEFLKWSCFKTFTMVDPHSIELDREDYTTYCEFDYELYTEDDLFDMDYYCRIRGADDDSKLCLTESEDGLTYMGGFLSRFTDDSIYLIKVLCMEGREDEIRQLREETLARIEEEHFREGNPVFIWEYEDLCSRLNTEKIMLTDSYKVKITYLLQYSDGDILLGFKVGNVRDYVVKNAGDFLNAFISKETVSYGKDLVLTHDYENLTAEDRKVIQMLSGHSFRVPRENALKKYVYLDDEVMTAFMDMMKDRTIFYNGNVCRVRLNPKEVRICIDNEYKLQPNLNPENQQYIVSGEKAYIYDSQDNAIDCATGDPYRIWITNFCEKNKGISIKPILSGFKKDIYSGNADAFDIAPEISHAFKLSTVKIKAYFDYEDKKILLREELYKDDKKVKRADIKERSDIDCLNRFDTYIRQLGFGEGVITDEGMVMSFFKMDFSGLKKLANVYLSDNISSKRIMTVNRSVIKIQSGPSGIMEAFMEKSDYSEEELEKILQGLRRRKKYILLDKDRIVDLDSAEAREFEEVVKDLGLTPGALYEKKRIGMVNAIKAFAHSESCSIDKHLRNMMEEIRNFKEYEVAEPGMKLPMRGYQMDGYRWLSVLSNYGMGGILADDMGLGKTLQIIALIKNDKTKAPSLIVCPKSLIFNWINEFAKFDGITPTSEIYGSAQVREVLIHDIDYKKKAVYITSYDSLRNDISFYKGKFAHCILDEAQFIKNVDAQKSKSVKEIKAVHRFALTGTPIENNVVDLWSIFDFIMPGYFEELSAFKSEYNRDSEYTARIAKRIGPFVLRRIKENVLGDLPDKYEKIVSTEMTQGQRKLYDAIRKKAKERLDEGGKAFDMLPYLTQLRQICVDPQMCYEDNDSGSGKMQMLKQMIPEYLSDGHRILIFSQFVKGLNQVEQCLRELNIDYYMITGETGAKARIEMIEDYNSGSGTDVFLISLKAGGTGINLTGADVVIHLDPWWNVAAENQATDRAHRIGQTRNVEVIKLISENSIEQRVLELQNMKKDLFDRIISSDEKSVTGASLEDIAFILR